MAKIRKLDGVRYAFVCPACNNEHIFDSRWVFNGSFTKPTLSPSFLQKGFLGHKKNGEDLFGTCHSFVREGKIQFLGDCTHDLKGTTVELPDIE